MSVCAQALKRRKFWWILLACGWCGSGCRQSESPGAAATINITDDLGRRISLPGAARRIASLSPEHTEILFALGCGDQVVLRDKVSDHPPQVQRLPATNPFLLSPEHVAGFRPDLVLLSHGDSSRMRALDVLGIKVALFSPRTVKQLLHTINTLGELCGAAPSAHELTRDLQARVARVTEKLKDLPRPSVYIETDGTDPLKPWAAGPGSLVDHLVGLAGGRNLLPGARRFSQINAEEILRRDPEVILMMSVQGKLQGQGLRILRQRPGWSQLSAVSRGRVVDQIHADLLSRAGPRAIDGLEILARALHPGAFAETVSR